MQLLFFVPPLFFRKASLSLHTNGAIFYQRIGVRFDEELSGWISRML